MLLLVGPDWGVATISANAEMLGLGDAQSWLSRPIADMLGDDAVHEIRNRMAWLGSERALAHDYAIRLGPAQATYDLQVRMHGDHYLIEAEPTVEQRLPDSIGMARSMMDRVSGHDFREIADSGLRQIRALTGFHCVTLYDRDGNVLTANAAATVSERADEKGPDGLEFPRVIVDRDAECVALLGHEIDVTARRSSFCEPDDVERGRLSRHGFAAGMALPLGIDGERVGTVVAHHRTPKRCGAERRAVAGLLADRLAARMTRHGWKP